jgi:NADH-quinone oxidoreductase subunit E
VSELPLDPALVEGRSPDGPPEEIPEIHETGCPDELRERIEELMSRYPDRRSASIPALWAVQHRYGWCTPEGIRQAAAVMRVTPAYLESVATFYDLLHTEPVGNHKVLVCTNISCWMQGGDELLAAFCDASGCDPIAPGQGGETSEDGEFYVTPFECLGACDLAPMASIDGRYFGPLESNDANLVVQQLLSGAEPLPEKALARRGAAGGPEPDPDPRVAQAEKSSGKARGAKKGS